MMRLTIQLISAQLLLMTLAVIVRAECPKDGPVHVTLTAGEFEIPGYDATQGLLAVRPSKTLEPSPSRSRPVTLVMDSRDIFIPVPPAALKEGLESLVQLELLLEGEPGDEAKPPSAKPDCGRVVIRRASLHRDGMEIGRGAVRRRGPSPVHVQATIQVERGTIDTKTFLRQTKSIAESCLRRRTFRQKIVRGAISIQLEEDVVGRPLKPSVVVDGLVDDDLSTCLLNALYDSGELWEHMEPATRVYLNVFFRLRSAE